MKDYRSLEHKIRLLVEGRLTPGGWERKTKTLWWHPVAEIARVIDEDGNERFINKAGDVVVELTNSEKRMTPDQSVKVTTTSKETNTEKRMAEPNVGRPGKNKQRKQAEIINKYVDDDQAESIEQDDTSLVEKKDEDDDKKPKDDKKKPKDDSKKDTPPYGKDKAKTTSDKDDPKKVKGGKTEVDTEPETNDNIDAEKDEKKTKKKDKDCKEWFTPEELDYFDAIMAEEYVDMSKKTCDELINAKGKPHKVYTATDETRHGMGVDELKRHLGVGDSDSVHKKFMHNLHTAGVRTGWSHSAGKWIAYQGKKV